VDYLNRPVRPALNMLSAEQKGAKWFTTRRMCYYPDSLPIQLPERERTSEGSRL